MRHLLELFLFFIVLMGLPDWYIFRTYVSQWKKKGIRILYWLPSILILIGMIYTFGSFEPKPPMMQRMGSFLILFLCIITVGRPSSVKAPSLYWDGLHSGSQ